MPLLSLVALECKRTQGSLDTLSPWFPDQIRIEIYVDGVAQPAMRHTMHMFDRWFLKRVHAFTSTARIVLWEEDRDADPADVDPDDRLGDHTLDTTLVPRDTLRFDDEDADYRLWYQVSDGGFRLRDISLRRMLGRAQPGAIDAHGYRSVVGADAIYRCAEVIDLRDTFSRHAAQDGPRGATTSVREWIERHCNVWGEDSVIPFEQVPTALVGVDVGSQGNWKVVESEATRTVAGLQHASFHTDTDSPFAHATMDWNWNQILDPAYSYLLSYATPTRSGPDGTQVPFIHNELETGSFPLEWRPFRGEYVTTRGRHVYDRGHAPVKAEIHPAHTVVREVTTASQLGRAGGPWVPVNRVTIGMGLSGGFLGWDADLALPRWQHEFGGAPEVSLTLPLPVVPVAACLPTNLERQRLDHRVFPPVARPPGASLVARTVQAEMIVAADQQQLVGFLSRCQGPWFHRWSGVDGFAPQPAPPARAPRLVVGSEFVDVAVDLQGSDGIVLGYLAVIECGWSERGAHDLRQYDVTFDSIEVLDTRNPAGDFWWLFYGSNGEWGSWRRGNLPGKTYPIGHTMIVRCVDDLPLLIEDCGIQWQGIMSGESDLQGAGNVELDPVRLRASGPGRLEDLAHRVDDPVLSAEAGGVRTLSFQVEGQPDPDLGWMATRHRWSIDVRRTIL